MENKSPVLLDKIILYGLAILCPLIALLAAVMLGFEKQKNQLLERVKIISLYEMLDFTVAAAAFCINGTNGIKYSLLGLLLFYTVLCAVTAHRKKDYITRGIFLGLFANHYSLAIYQTSENSTSKIDNSKYPDFGLAMYLMITKVIFTLLIFFAIKYFIPVFMTRITTGL